MVHNYRNKEFKSVKGSIIKNNKPNQFDTTLQADKKYNKFLKTKYCFTDLPITIATTV